ncbi:hypothetical protein B0H16DRAFT_1809002 [Mycena metata]|uniref:Uncharacterized protein n=1 Tax=Mycena metata TaxID=1033252 RepID=A0AAD7MFA4_9AGAR|nr:hypothetical protein B0H16DRAFT_1809002 [Mycena metata]
MLSGVITVMARANRRWPFLVGSPIFSVIGSGLLYTLNATTSPAKLVGFQILAGFRNTPKILGQATSMASFAQFLEPIFSSLLAKTLLKYAPNAPASIIKESPTTIRSALPAGMIAGVVRSYTESLRVVFVLVPQHPQDPRAGDLHGVVRANPGRDIGPRRCGADLHVPTHGKFAQVPPNAPVSIVKESPTTIRSALPADMIAGVVRSYTETSTSLNPFEST